MRPLPLVLLGLLGCVHGTPAARPVDPPPDVAAHRRVLDRVLPAGTVGVLLIRSGVATIVFPGGDLRDAEFNARDRVWETYRFLPAGDLVVIAEGFRATVAALPFETVNWCVNDGGPFGRPEAKVEVAAFAGLPARGELDGFAAFVIVAGPDGTVALPPGMTVRVPSAERAVLDLDHDGAPEFVLSEEPSDAGCGDALEQASLELKTNRGPEPLRCCGP